jgi:hypothetical protein
MMDTSIDNRPLIRCAWPDAGIEGAGQGPVHTLSETAAYMREHGMPNASEYEIRQIEQRALRKLRHNPEIQQMRKELNHA